MNIEELRVEINSTGIRDEIEEIFKHPVIQKNFEHIVAERLNGNECLMHGEPIGWEKFESEEGEGYKLTCCCPEYGALAETYLERLRHDLWKLCLVLAVTHKSVGCEKYVTLWSKLEEYEFKGVKDFFETFYGVCIEVKLFDKGLDQLKEKFETLFEGIESNIH